MAREYVSGSLEKAQDSARAVLQADPDNETALMITEGTGYMFGNTTVTDEQFAHVVNLLPGSRISAAMKLRELTGWDVDTSKKYVEYFLLPLVDISSEEPARPAPTTMPKKKGCYVATAVYGSYDCPEVWVLRRFRDYRLAKSKPGRAFIIAYYKLSPSIVEHLGGKAWFRKINRALLDPFVAHLEKRGFGNTPYQD